MNKSYKIIFWIIVAILLLAFLLGIAGGDKESIKGFLFLSLFPISVLLYIALGIFCFSRPTLKPIFISTILGITFSIILLLVLFSLYFNPEDKHTDLLGFGIAIYWIFYSILLFIVAILIGLIISYLKTRNKIVLIFFILWAVLILVLLGVWLYIKFSFGAG